jgi:hypothetical protein
MKRYVILAIIVSSLAFSYDPKIVQGEEMKKHNDQTVAACSKSSKRIVLKVNLKNEKFVQDEVDKGHQPWRLNAVDVAYATLSSMDKNVTYEDCKSVNESRDQATVQCRSSQNYIVHLRKLVRPDGIWTAIEIEVTK